MCCSLQRRPHTSSCAICCYWHRICVRFRSLPTVVSNKCFNIASAHLADSKILLGSVSKKYLVHIFKQHLGAYKHKSRSASDIFHAMRRASNPLPNLTFLRERSFSGNTLLSSSPLYVPDGRWLSRNYVNLDHFYINNIRMKPYFIDGTSSAILTNDSPEEVNVRAHYSWSIKAKARSFVQF